MILLNPLFVCTNISPFTKHSRCPGWSTLREMCCEMMYIVLITVRTSVLLLKAIQWALVAWFRPQAALFDIPALNHKFLHIVNFSLFLPLHLFIRELHTLHKSI